MPVAWQQATGSCRFFRDDLKAHHVIGEAGDASSVIQAAPPDPKPTDARTDHATQQAASAPVRAGKGSQRRPSGITSKRHSCDLASFKLPARLFLTLMTQNSLLRGITHQ